MRIEVRSLCKSFGERRVLDCLELSVDFPHVLALLGPSGGGKSTLLRVIAGLEIPNEGGVVLDGEMLPAGERELRAYRRRLGIVFQAFNLFPHMTALANVSLPLSAVHGMTAEEAESRALAMLDRLGLSEHAGKRPYELSGGQRQRVAIARAIAPKPRLLLLDEPTSALDPEMTSEVLSLIEELKAERIPMLLITHEMGFARKVADQVAFLADGKVLEMGSGGEFFSQASTEAARRFLKKVLAY